MALPISLNNTECSDAGTDETIQPSEGAKENADSGVTADTEEKAPTTKVVSCEFGMRESVNQKAENIRGQLEETARSGVMGDKFELDTKKEKMKALGIISKGSKDLTEKTMGEHGISSEFYVGQCFERSMMTIVENPGADLRIVNDQVAPCAVVDVVPKKGDDLPSSIPVYSGHGRTQVTTVRFSKEDWDSLLKPLKGDLKSPEEERDAASEVLADYEKIVHQKRFPEDVDFKKRDPGGWAGNDVSAEERIASGTMDCIDETNNTQQLLSLLSRQGYFKYHTAVASDLAMRKEPAKLGYHMAAVMTESESSARWVFDTWVNDGFEPPVVQSEEEWMRDCTPFHFYSSSQPEP